MKTRGSSVGIATGYGLEYRGLDVLSWWGLGIFLFSTASRPALGPTQPRIQWVPVGGLFLKLPGPEADHSLLVPRSRIRGAYTSTPTRLHSVVLR
jgi:hypothetical protein